MIHKKNNTSVKLILLSISLMWVFSANTYARKFSSDLSKWQKKYGIARYDRVAVHQQASDNSTVVSHILFGRWLRVITEVNPAQVKTLPRLGKWLKVKTQKGVTGYTKISNLLLLDDRQKPLWKRNYSSYEIIRTKKEYEPVTARWSTHSNFVEPINNQTQIKLYPGSIVWCEKKTRTNCFFRYLGHKFNYSIYYIPSRHLKKTSYP